MRAFESYAVRCSKSRPSGKRRKPGNAGTTDIIVPDKPQAMVAIFEHKPSVNLLNDFETPLRSLFFEMYLVLHLCQISAPIKHKPGHFPKTSLCHVLVARSARLIHPPSPTMPPVQTRSAQASLAVDVSDGTRQTTTETNKVELRLAWVRSRHYEPKNGIVRAVHRARSYEC